MLQFKIQALLIISFVFLSGIIFVSDSYGIGLTREHQTLHEVFLQLIIRNSDGQLVTYVEPTNMWIVNISDTHLFLDQLEDSEKTTMVKKGENVEMIKFVETNTFSESGQYSSYGLVFDDYRPLLFRHDGYLTHPGDTLMASWKIVRTIDR